MSQDNSPLAALSLLQFICITRIFDALLPLNLTLHFALDSVYFLLISLAHFIYELRLFKDLLASLHVSLNVQLSNYPSNRWSIIK